MPLLPLEEMESAPTGSPAPGPSSPALTKGVFVTGVGSRTPFARTYSLSGPEAPQR